MENNFELFGGKTYSNLLEDIYNNSKYKRTQTEELIFQLKAFILDAASASVIAPIIKEVLSVSVRNDEQLVKLAQIVQRIIETEKKGTGGDMMGDAILTEEEKQEILKQMEAVEREARHADKSIGTDLKEIEETTKKYGISLGSS